MPPKHASRGYLGYNHRGYDRLHAIWIGVATQAARAQASWHAGRPATVQSSYLWQLPAGRLHAGLVGRNAMLALTGLATSNLCAVEKL